MHVAIETTGRTSPARVFVTCLLDSNLSNGMFHSGMLGGMTDVESRRLDLYNRFQEVLGTDPATTLMTHLPPVAVENLMTGREFAEFKTEVRQRFDQLDARFDTIDSRFDTIDSRFDTIDSRFDTIDSKFDGVNKRIDRVLLSVVGGLFVVVAAFIGLTAL